MGAKKNKDNEPPKDVSFQSVEQVEALLLGIKDSLKKTTTNSPDNLPEMLMGLTAAVASLVAHLKDVPKVSKYRDREMADEIDDLRQRNMKGNLILFTTKNSNFIKTEEMLT